MTVVQHPGFFPDYDRLEQELVDACVNPSALEKVGSRIEAVYGADTLRDVLEYTLQNLDHLHWWAGYRFAAIKETFGIDYEVEPIEYRASSLDEDDGIIDNYCPGPPDWPK
jgi:hypothetical protein